MASKKKKKAPEKKEFSAKDWHPFVTLFDEKGAVAGWRIEKKK